MRESKIESAIVKEAQGRGWLVYKFMSPMNSGVPDRIFMRKGQVFFIEFKSEKGKLTPLQRHQFELIRRHGLKVFVISSVEDGCQLLESLDA